MPTTTTYRLVSRLGHQRKDRLFAEYEVTALASGRSVAYVSYYNYSTGRRESGYMVDHSTVVAAVVRWALERPEYRVKYTHYEDAA